MIIYGDALTELRKLPSESVYCCVTSPPYCGLRDYGHKAQIGLEASPQAYVLKLLEIFREVRRVLKDDGTLWLVLGDSYATGAGKVGECPGGGIQGGRWAGRPRGPRPTGKAGLLLHSRNKILKPIGPLTSPNRLPVLGLKPKDLVGIPWRVAFALQADGWYLRQDIIWAKPNPMPESVMDRCTKAHEYIFLLTKSARYYYDAGAIREPSIGGHDSGNGFLGRQGGARNCPISGGPGSEKQWERQASVFGRSGPVSKHVLPGQSAAQHRPRSSAKFSKADPQSAGRKMLENTVRAREKSGVHDGQFGPYRNRRSVWTVATRPFNGAHFATFPPDLIGPMILAGCPAGGVVLDPFFGAGTVGFIAARFGRDYIGIELNPAYCEMAKKRIYGNLYGRVPSEILK